MVHRSAIVFVTVALLPIWIARAQPAEERADIRFEFANAVSAVDRVSIEQGIWFAQEAFGDLFGTDAPGPVAVTVDDDETLRAPHGVRDSRQIFINTFNYRGMSALVQAASVVHEYFHVWQFGVSARMGGQSGPYWFMEGSAEFIAYWVLAQAGLVSHEDVHEFFVLMANGAHAQEPVNLPALSDLASPDSMFAPGVGCCSYHLAALAVEMLVDEPGVEALGAYFEGVSALGPQGGGWETVFEETFGQSPEAFYQAFEARRAEILTPAGRDVAPLLLTPPFNEGAADISLTVVPRVVERGEPTIMTGETAPGTLCSLTLTAADGGEVLTYPTYADVYGLVFWLWTIDEKIGPEPVTGAAACGGEAVITTFDA